MADRLDEINVGYEEAVDDIESAKIVKVDKYSAS